MISVEDFASDLECERDNVARSDEPLIIGQDDDELETLVGGMTLADSPLQPALARGEILAAPFSHAEVYPLYPVAKHRGEPSNPSSQSQTTYLQPPSAARPLSSIPRFVLSPLSAATQASLGNMPGPMHVESMGSAIPLAYERRRRSTGNGPNSNNKVDIEKIRRGGDVRTTVWFSIQAFDVFFSQELDHASQYTEQDGPGKPPVTIQRRASQHCLGNSQRNR